MDTMNEWMASEKVANDNFFSREFNWLHRSFYEQRSENIVITSILQPFA